MTAKKALFYARYERISMKARISKVAQDLQIAHLGKERKNETARD